MKRVLIFIGLKVAELAAIVGILGAAFTAIMWTQSHPQLRHWIEIGWAVIAVISVGVFSVGLVWIGVVANWHWATRLSDRRK